MSSIKFDFTYLLAFVRQEKELVTIKNLAKFLGISTTCLNNKIMNKTNFNAEEIGKMKKHFNLTNDQIALFFFHEKLEKWYLWPYTHA